MMIILAGTKEEHLNMLEGGIIAKLLEEKWSTFAQVSDEIFPKLGIWIYNISRIIVSIINIYLAILH